MRINKLAIGIITVLASTSVLAEDAVLNVEGQIQINGKTVIDSTGKFVGELPSEPDTNTINIADYYKTKTGNYSFKYTNVAEEFPTDGTSDMVMKTSYCSDVVEIKEGSESGVFSCEDNYNVPEEDHWSNVYNDDGTEKYTSTYESCYVSTDNPNEVCETVTNTRTTKVEAVSKSNDIVALGNSISYVDKATILDTTYDYEDHRIDYTEYRIDTFSVTAVLPEYTVLGNKYKDCIMLSYDERSFEVLCKDYGTVQRVYSTYDQTNSFELVSFKADGEAEKALNATAMRQHQKAVVKRMVAKN